MPQALHAAPGRQTSFFDIASGPHARHGVNRGRRRERARWHHGGGNMLLAGHAHTVNPGEGRTVNLGIIQMRVLAAGEDMTNRAFTLAEFTGGEGPWTV